MLALARWERPDPRLADLYDRFPRDCVSSLLDSLLGEAAPSGPSSCSSSQGAASSEAGPSHQQGELARAAFLATEAELATLVGLYAPLTVGARWGAHFTGASGLHWFGVYGATGGFLVLCVMRCRWLTSCFLRNAGC